MKHYSPVILTANLNDFAFVLGWAWQFFYQVGLTSQKGGPKPGQVELSPPPSHPSL